MTRRYGHPGEQYGYLTIVEGSESHKCPCGSFSRMVVCQCDCGKTVTVYLSAIRSGNTSSCGCRQHVTHGLTKSSTWQSWRSMRKRCTYKTDPEYRNYGGRGIEVCERWLNSFEAFLEDMGESPEGYTIERDDPNGNYEPGNCRWATRLEQSRNRRVNRYVEYNNERLCLAEWGERIGLSGSAIGSRLDRGWSVEEALTKPRYARRNK